NEFVTRRKWLSAGAYADAVALCQFLPGPASSQTGMVIGFSRAGIPGMFAAWLGFTLPSAILLTAFGYGVGHIEGIASAPWLHGLKIVAVAIVAQAVCTMGRTLCPDPPRIALAAVAAALALAAPSALGQVGAIVLGAVCGWAFLRGQA